MLWLLLTASLLAACKEAPEYRPDLGNQHPRPALWEVTAANGTGGRAFLFGTIHLLPEGIGWQDERIDEAVAESDALVLEVTGLEDSRKVSAIFGQLALSPAGSRPDVLLRLPPDLRDEAREVADKGGVDLASLDRMDSWAAALQLASGLHADLGLSQDEGVESRLTRQFEARGKPVLALESIGYQLGLFDALSETQQRALLRNVIEEADTGRAEFETMLGAWLRGDDTQIDRLSRKGLLAEGPVREILLVRRNREWAGQIARQIADGKRVLVAVGAAHLAGADGVPALMRQQGFRVRRMR